MVEDIEDEVIRVAVVQYSDDTKTYFDLNSHKTKSAIVYAVRGLRHKGGISRNTGQALKFVHDLVSTPLSGSRKLEGVPQILILLTGGKSKSAQRDIVFLLDGSDETLGMFPAMQSFVQSVVESLNVGENTDRVSVVQYSDEPETEISLNTYFDKQDVLDTIQSMIHMGGEMRSTGAALEYVQNEVFTSTAGSRNQDGVPQILVFGGRSSDDVRRAAQSLRDNGVKTVSIGTSNADTLEMQTVANTPAYYISMPNFDNLQNLNQRIEATADIVFLLDGTKDMLPSEKPIWDFIMGFVEQLQIGPSRMQVALIEYNTEPTVHFALNKYTSRDDLLLYLKYTELSGRPSVNLGAALDYVRTNVFTAASGSRAMQGIPQLLILVTARKSDDDIVGPLDRLQKTGIVTYSIGINNADRMEVEQLAHSPETKYLDVSDFTPVREQIMSGKATQGKPLYPTLGE
uniref:VWFA domain-containing protein n=1 Tax=Periophthalmus magnuspinnatus TaxID=409849 RepID=A0A3B4B750_9GOBI